MAAERGKARSMEDTRRAARLVQHLRVRGDTASAVVHALANARQWLGRCAGVMRRELYNFEVGHGFRADGRGRWAVDEILEWRGNGDEREALVRWLGFNSISGEPWEDSWRPRRSLTADLRETGRVRKRKLPAADAEGPPRDPGALPVVEVEGVIVEGRGGSKRLARQDPQFLGIG